MPRLAVFMLLCAVLVSTPVSAQPSPVRPGQQVSTRNLYIGTDFAPFSPPSRPRPTSSAVAQARRPSRRLRGRTFRSVPQALAAEIAAIQPHLIGVQEALNFTLNGANSPPFRRYPGDVARGPGAARPALPGRGAGPHPPADLPL